MNGKINKKEFIKELAFKMETTEKDAETWLNATVDVFYEAFQARQSVTIENFGNFYIKEKDSICVFKFNPSQKLKYYLGWSSSYKPK